MSHSKVSAIRFSKDNSLVQVKHACSNDVPKFYEWSNWMPIEDLYSAWRVGNIQFNSFMSNEQVALVKTVFDLYGHEPILNQSYYDLSGKIARNEASQLEIERIEGLHKAVKDNLLLFLSNYSAEKKYVVYMPSNRKYVHKMNQKSFLATYDQDSAKLFSKHIAGQVIRKLNLEYGYEAKYFVKN